MVYTWYALMRIRNEGMFFTCNTQMRRRELENGLLLVCINEVKGMRKWSKEK